MRMTIPRRNALLATLEKARRVHAQNLAGTSRMATEGWPHSGTQALRRIAELEQKIRSNEFTREDMRLLREILRESRQH